MRSALACRQALALSLASVIMLAGCASVPAAAPPAAADLWHDAGFGPPGVAVDPAAALAVSDAMKRYVREQIKPLAHALGPRQALLTALFDRSQLQLDYDGAHTRNAAEAFDARAGNCLSLVLMTAALAQELDLPVRYQRVDSETGWSRSGGYFAFVSHVNVSLGNPRGSVWTSRLYQDPELTVDFLPPKDLGGHRHTQISEATVLAMYLNNRAAEALIGGRLNDAYAWVRAAARTDPGYTPALNTLALVYRRHGDEHRAERALRAALAQGADNPRVLSNLLDLLTRAGRVAEAAPLAARLAQIEPEPPFQDFQRGLKAMREQRYEQARDWFVRALARDPNYHEFHHQMALASMHLGEMAAARRHFERAAQASPTLQAQALYQAKRDRLTGAAAR